MSRTACAAFDGIGPLGGILPEFEADPSQFANLTMCDISAPSEQEQIALVGTRFPNEGCTADLWRFDIDAESWVRQPEPAITPRVWPAANCGAVAIPAAAGDDREGQQRRQQQQQQQKQQQQYQHVTIVGGWDGQGGGECETWGPLAILAVQLILSSPVCPLIRASLLNRRQTYSVVLTRTFKASARSRASSLWRSGSSSPTLAFRSFIFN